MAFNGSTGVLGQPVEQDEYGQAPALTMPQVLDNPTGADQQRQQQMALAWNAYQGKLADPLKQQQDGLNDNAKSNRLKPIVQKGASFLFPPDVAFSVAAQDKGTVAPNSGEVETGELGAQEWLGAFWKANRQQTLLNKIGINGGIFGHTFVKIVPAGDVNAAGRSQSFPRLVIVNPQNVRVETEPDDCDTVRAYIISYQTIDGASVAERRQVIERVDPDGDAAAGAFDIDATWLITDQHRGVSVNNRPWVTDKQTPWPYEFPPIFDTQNLPMPNDYWGEEDITNDLIEQAMAINFNQSNVSRILKWHASPLTWGKGIGNGSIDRSPDNIVVLQGPDAELHNLEMVSDLHSSLDYLAMLRANMDEQSRVPAVALGRQSDLPKGNLSGVALQLLFQPLLEKTTQKRGLYGPMLEMLCAAVLVLAGYADRMEDISVTVNWPQVLPQDPNADWQVAPIKMQAGVSQSTILEEAGYDPAEEQLLRSADAQGTPVVSATPSTHGVAEAHAAEALHPEANNGRTETQPPHASGSSAGVQQTPSTVQGQ